MKKKSDSKQVNSQAKRIAVIEEIADDIYSIKFVLQSIGYKVDSFSSRDSYQKALDEFSPHLIVVDMMIPNRGAYRSMRELGESRLKKVPILAITAQAMEGDDQEVYQAGGRDILSKPYEVGDLREKLEKWLK
ncbi:MAG: response regulator [Acidobacteriota bacterium]